MIVGVDVSAVPDEPRGAGRYITELVRALARRGEVELRLEARRDTAERWRGIAPSAEVAGVVPRERWRRVAWEQIASPRFVDRWGIDLLHSPHYTMPEIARVPKLVTIHDMTFFDHPDRHERVKVSFFTRAIKVAVQRANAIVCVSEHTAERLRARLAVSVPVHVIPHGIDHSLFTPEPKSSDARERDVLGARQPYLLFVGTLEPRKDLATLVEAFERLARDDLQLVIAGGSGWRNDAFERALTASARAPQILRTGFVSDDAVAALYRGAAAVIYAAVDEGFGLPVLESLACGAPTITTEGSVMDALADGGALLAPPSDAQALAAVIERALAGGSGSLRERGLEVAARYTWDATAARHESAYREVVGRVRGA